MTLVLQIGQCGNQLGYELFRALYKESQSDETVEKRYFHLKKGELTPNAILIDMESKVIEEIFKDKNEFFRYDKDCVFTKEEGSGNNWAFGYEKHGKNCAAKIFLIFEKLVEKIDDIDSVIFLQSMAGGSGSGVGSFLVESLSENFPEFFYINYLVAPKKGGEVIIQNYNIIFSFSTVYQFSDYVFILQNDRAEKICQKLFKMSKSDMNTINSILSKDIVASLLTENGDENSSRKKRTNSFLDTFNTLKLFPISKLFGTRFIPHTNNDLNLFFTETWKSLLNRALQLQINGEGEAMINWNMNPLTSPNIIKSLSTYFSLNSKSIFDDFNEKNLPFEIKRIFSNKVNKANFDYAFFKRQFQGVEKSIGLITNSQEYVNYFDEVFEKAKNMFTQKAYFFQYQKFGLEEDTMRDYFFYFNNINDFYKNI